MKCHTCGAKVVRFPIKGQQEKTFKQNYDEGTVNWINFLRMDMQSIIMFILIVTMVLGYKADIAKCDDAINNPCDFCETTNCCEVNWMRVNPSKMNMSMDIEPININDH